jgi:hypothetical protein
MAPNLGPPLTRAAGGRRQAAGVDTFAVHCELRAYCPIDVSAHAKPEINNAAQARYCHEFFNATVDCRFQGITFIVLS